MSQVLLVMGRSDHFRVQKVSMEDTFQLTSLAPLNIYISARWKFSGLVSFSSFFLILCAEDIKYSSNHFDSEFHFELSKGQLPLPACSCSRGSLVTTTRTSALPHYLVMVWSWNFRSTARRRKILRSCSGPETPGIWIDLKIFCVRCFKWHVWTTTFFAKK